MDSTTPLLFASPDPDCGTKMGTNFERYAIPDEFMLIFWMRANVWMKILR